MAMIVKPKRFESTGPTVWNPTPLHHHILRSDQSAVAGDLDGETSTEQSTELPVELEVLASIMKDMEKP